MYSVKRHIKLKYYKYAVKQDLVLYIIRLSPFDQFLIKNYIDILFRIFK